MKHLIDSVGVPFDQSFVEAYAKAGTPAEKSVVCELEVERLRKIWRPSEGATDLVMCPVCGGSCVVEEEWCKKCKGYGQLRLHGLCDTCGGTKIISKGGEYIVCPECRQIENAHNVLRQARVPDRYLTWSFSSLEALGMDPESMEYSVCRLAAEGGTQFEAQIGRRGVFLYGGPGLGKTGLAISTLSQLAHKYAGQMAFATWEFYLESLRPQSEDGRGQKIAKSAQVDVQPTESMLSSSYMTILDDVGQVGDKFNAWRAEQLYRVLDTRIGWNGGLTMITSNLSPEKFEAAFGARAWSRVEGLCWIVACEGEDMRKRQGEVVA